ncbi:MAG: PH domain-containing protein [Gaiellaceae bacterium]
MAAEEEREIWSGRPSWRGRMAILVPGVLLTILALVVCLWAGLSGLLTIVVVGIVALVTVVWAFLETIRWKYTITNRRVFVRHGLVSIHEQTARLERVQDVTLHQTLFDRMFGVGRLLIDTAGSSGGALEFKALLEPTRVREVLDAAVRAEQHADPV